MTNVFTITDAHKLKPSPSTFTLYGMIDGENVKLVSVDLSTGKHTFGEKYTPDDAARAFWQAIEAMGAKPCK